jgi:gluconate 2-dehydrogenase alpha chain
MIKHPEVEVVIVGGGWTGGILAAELGKAGKQVVMLERGHARDTADYQHRDELRYGIRHELMQDLEVESWTLRHSLGETALPYRYLGSWLPGTGMGGAGIHWAAQTWRFTDWDFKIRSNVLERYGASKIPSDMTIADWGIDYATLEPYYWQFEQMAGISGKAGNLKGKKVPGGNVLEAPRAHEYPVPPMPLAHAPRYFKEAAEKLGYHPFPGPSATLPQAYTNPDGVARGECAYCGTCTGFGCEVGAKADPVVTVLPVAMRSKRFELRTESNVYNITHSGKKATGVRYYDAAGLEHDQPAHIVILGAFMFNNVRLLLLSGMSAPYDPHTGTGVVGRNFAYQSSAGATGFFKNTRFNKWIGTGALQECIDDFYGDNFDHKNLDFIGGGNVSCGAGGLTPIANAASMPSTIPAWGSRWKAGMHDWYDRSIGVGMQGEVVAYKWRSVDLDPTYTDAHGHPLLRITFDWADNERNMTDYVAKKSAAIVKAAGADIVETNPPLPPHFDTVPYQSTHVTGGAIMGSDPSRSVVNNYLQMWDYPNVFIVGASAFPQNAGKNPTGTVGALAYRAADGIINHYMKSPKLLA